jgi:hypothetical protein
VRCGGVFSRRTHEQGGGRVGAAAQGDAIAAPCELRAAAARVVGGGRAACAAPAARGKGDIAQQKMSMQHVANKGWAVDGAISRCSCHRRGGKPRRDGCPHARAAFLFAVDATGVTRRGWAGNCRAALPYSRGWEPRRPVAALHIRDPQLAVRNGSARRGREGCLSRCSARLARVGAAAHRLRAPNVRDPQPMVCNGCGAARVERGSRAALTDRRGREPRRDPLRNDAINSRSSHVATGVTRRGRGGVPGGSMRSRKRSGMRRSRSGVVSHARERALRVSFCVRHTTRCSTRCRLRLSAEARIVGLETASRACGLIRRERC